MRTVGYLLLTIAFLCGAFVTVLDPRLINWWLMIPALLVGVIGMVLIRKSIRSEAQVSTRVESDLNTMRESLASIARNLEEMNAIELPVYEARFEIDHKLRQQLIDFADSRQSMVHAFGLQNYAEVMSGFAAGERYVNRVWSASTDGYIDEVRKYLRRALEQFNEALGHFDGLMAEFRPKT
ncbi:MAG: hypothetical protein IMF09_09315 [Proteobacteria bacterium]|nr:hypothetical protein [Pseudomonadota bacterium]